MSFLEACPHCGGDQYYAIVRVSGKIQHNRRFDGVVADNTELWDTVRQVDQKRMYCADCDKPLPRNAVLREPGSVSELLDF